MSPYYSDAAVHVFGTGRHLLAEEPTMNGEELKRRVEQRLALGDLPDEIARRLGVDVEKVDEIAEAMDAAAWDEDSDDTVQQRADPQMCGSGRHLLAGRNLINRPDGRRECRACKRDRDRAWRRQKKAA